MRTNQPKVSIVTVFYNRSNYFEPSIASLLSQSYPDIEIIIVDDGSEDDTMQKMSAISDQRVKRFCHSNIGFTRSLIEGIRNSTGELIAIHDSGDISHPDRIEKQANFLLDNRNVVAVGSSSRVISSDNTLSAIKLPSIATKRNFKPFVYSPFNHGTAMYWKWAYEKAGGYRPAFEYCQDLDLWTRMIRIGKLDYIEEALYDRVVMDGMISNSPLKTLMQSYFASLALQCYEERQKGSKDDVVDRYGIGALFFRKKSRHFYKRASKIIKNCVRDNDLGSMRFVYERMAEERFTSSASLMCFLNKLTYGFLFKELLRFKRKKD